MFINIQKRNNNSFLDIFLLNFNSIYSEIKDFLIEKQNVGYYHKGVRDCAFLR